ncbi:unnamed protein product [Prorocentrum cordatum]|uniref:J domain-containing protein n=1 Tax=Prorocentrum cordatum TaxID=2364126 RepID=A0ABN9SL08_9DINO|nr:unnamed protein product [Polarella glacialis]
MLRVAPLDQGATGVEARSSQAVPPREEAVRALQEGGFPLGLLDQIDLQVQEARANGEDALATTLKKCMIQMHPDRNPGREEVVPIFKYLRRLRVEQNLFKRGRMEESSKKSVLSKLRKKQRRVSAEP